MTTLRVRVVPRAAKPGPAGLRDGAIVMRLNAAPVDGAANAELIAVLSDLLDIRRRDITIVSGETSRLKTIRIEGVDEATALSRLGVRRPLR